MSPYLATSASPERRSRSGSVASAPDVGEDGGGLGEGADEVLSLRQVHRGLPADRGVDLRGERRRHLHERDAPHVGGGDEAGEVADRSPAQRHHDVVPVGLLGRELAKQRLVDLQGLRRLARRDAEEDGAEVPLQEALREGGEPGIRHGSVADHERLRGPGELRQMLGGGLDDAGADRHVVGAPRDRDGHPLHRSSSSIERATSLGVPLPSTTRAANSRYRGSRSASRRSRSDAS